MGQAQMSKNSGFWEIWLLEIHSKNYMLNFFHAKYLLKYSFLLIQQLNFIIFLFFKLFFKMVVKTKFHASWHCVLCMLEIGCFKDVMLHMSQTWRGQRYSYPAIKSLWFKKVWNWNIRIYTFSWVLEQVDELVSSAERSSESSSAEQANDWAVRANEPADKGFSKCLHPNYWLD